jgi:hydroxymethylpyrimidine/phosphomethylpyrimidine kinase
VALWRVAITIAGLDSGGGAGIGADLKTFAAMGVHGAAAVTCVTAQNTREVREVHCLSPPLVRAQIMAVWDDMGVDAGKTGMLGTREIVEAVAETVSRLGLPLVVDPVMEAKAGVRLLADDAVEALRRRLIPLARVVTPNRYEAEVLAGVKIRSVEDAKRAAELIHRELGAGVVVVKGGHLDAGEAVDVVYAGGTFHELAAPRLSSRATHGAGCCFSAAIAAGLAKGLGPLEAVRQAKQLLLLAMEYGVDRGRGHWAVNPTAWLEIPAERWRAEERLREALRIIEEHAEVFGRLIPEVQSNIGYSIDPRYARGRSDVVAVPGRVVNYMGRARPSGPPVFGASDHIARKILAAMARDAGIRAAMNVRYDEALLRAAAGMGMLVVYVDRRREPEDVKRVEGASMRWVVEEAFRQSGGRAPDLIADLGDWGKEPVITVLGRDPVDVVMKVLEAAGSRERASRGGNAREAEGSLRENPEGRSRQE